MEPTALILILLLFLLPIATAKVSDQELNAAISALRSHGYSLFPNAIATSDLGLHLLTSNTTTFTLFAPPDPLLYSLDLSSWAPHYTASLLLHVAPSRLNTSDLRHLTTAHPSLGGPYIKTLLPQHSLLVGKSRVVSNATALKSVKVDGVRVLVPDLFLGSDIAVHGLEGILVGGLGSDADVYGADLGFSDWVSPAPAPMGKGIDGDRNEHGSFSKF